MKVEVRGREGLLHWQSISPTNNIFYCSRMNEVDDLKRGVAGGSIMKGVFKVCFFFFSAIFIIIPVP